MATSKPRISLTMPVQLFEQVKNYRQYNHFATMSRAVLSLLKLGICLYTSAGADESQWLHADGVFFKRYCELDTYGKEAVNAVLSIESKRVHRQVSE